MAFLGFPAYAAAPDPMIEGAKLCTKQFPNIEKKYNIPKHLLSAISTTETGRYHNGLKISIPWPWTINAAGKGHYFSSKAEAVAMVRKLQAKGVQSIDVGCMQVNIYHHAQAFASLEEAFDPAHNIAYAAKFLRNLYDEGKSWKQAAAAYHSKTPEKGSRYVGRVYNSWERLVDKLRLAKLQIPESSLSVMKDMRPAPVRVASNTVVDARTFPKSQVKKIAQLPERERAKLAVYHPPRMRTIELSHKEAAEVKRGDFYVRPEIQTAAVPPSVLPDTGVLRVNSEHSGTRRVGPNFIFSD